MNKDSNRWVEIAGYGNLRVYQDRTYKNPIPGFKRYRIDRRVFFFFWVTSMTFIG